MAIGLVESVAVPVESDGADQALYTNDKNIRFYSQSPHGPGNDLSQLEHHVICKSAIVAIDSCLSVNFLLNDNVETLLVE